MTTVSVQPNTQEDADHAHHVILIEFSALLLLVTLERKFIDLVRDTESYTGGG